MIIGLCILGATGRMGGRILQLALEDPQFHVSGTHLETALPACNVVIDFTSPLATKKHLEAAVAAGRPLVLGTTGHSPEDKEEIEKASRSIPIFYSPNFSFGMTLCLEVAAKFGKVLEGSIDIVETHHIQKKDSPSGTALALAHAVGLDKTAIRSIRSGDVIGEHTVIFECGHERIELKHTAHSRDAFALGALKAAKFLVEQPPGLYQ